MKKILIFGKNSFVASGIEENLIKNGYEVDFFTRGEENRKKNIIFGKIENILGNPFFSDEYNTVINYVVLKDQGIQENIKFIENLLNFCEDHKVKKFVHFSSIMVYNYQEKTIDEYSKIEALDKTSKKGYGEIKIAVDEYLISVKDQYSFEIILVRPGYVLDETRACPFVKTLPLDIHLIKGNKLSKQPIVKKEDIHKALIKIISLENNLSVYHFFPNNNQTKYNFAKEKFRGKIITMPEFLFNNIPKFFNKIGLFPKSLYSRFEGMYIKTIFSSNKTEEKLNLKFE